MKIFACEARKIGILAVSTTKFNIFKEKKTADGYRHYVSDGGELGIFKQFDFRGQEK